MDYRGISNIDIHIQRCEVYLAISKQRFSCSCIWRLVCKFWRHAPVTLLGLYSDLVVEAKNSDVYLKNPDSPVPNNLFSDRLPAISGFINTLRGIDYAPFKENDISKQWNTYRGKEFQSLDNHAMACRTHLFLAINQEKLRTLDRQITYYNPTAKDHDVSVTLKKMKADAIERARAIEELQDCISTACANRYQWKEEKANLQSLEIGLPTENPRLASFFED